MHPLALLLAALLALGGVGPTPPRTASAPVSPPSRVLGVTFIVGIVNKTSATVTVTSLEDKPLLASLAGLQWGSGPKQIQVAPGQSLGWGYAVPWCTSQSDYDKSHYITVQVQSAAKTWYVWQSNENWQDRIRFFDQPWWKPQATPIAGASGVDGDRVLEINADGSLYLRKP